MRSKRLLIIFILILATAFLGVARQDNPPFSNKGVEFKIYPHQSAAPDSNDNYRFGGSIKIRCAWKNVGKKSIAFDLVDRDDYRRTDWPPLMLARVADAQGQVLTNNKFYAEGWWTSYSSGDFILENLITIKPGEELTRIVPLDKILLRAPGLPEGLKPGTYVVELSIGKLVSNKLKITVAPRG